MTKATEYEVSYAINPWMTPDVWQENPVQFNKAALDASDKLASTLTGVGAVVMWTTPIPGLPDMVFPANGAIVLNNRALVARFRHPERQKEEAPFNRVFMTLRIRGFLETVQQISEGCFQEGAGDCIWDDTRQHFWAGYGQRSCHDSISVIEDFFDVSVTPLELVTDRFYHLDTCFLVLEGGEILYYPPAFSQTALGTLRERVPASQLIEATDADAMRFCVNAVNVGRNIVMATPEDRLVRELTERGYTVHGVDLAPFMMSGGGAYCMTLRLDRKTRPIEACAATGLERASA